MSKKSFECPAVGKKIKPAECGANRVSKYNCPEYCPRNPWSIANYDQALEINDRFTEKLHRRMEHEGILGPLSRPPARDSEGGALAVMMWFLNKIFREKDSQGLTFKQRWEKSGYSGLNNDQRLHLEGEATFRAAVLEVQCVLDERTVQVVDLLRPDEEPFVVVDRAFASIACRFANYLTVIYDMPHYRRIHTTAISLPTIDGISMVDAFREIANLLGAPMEDSALHKWLEKNIIVLNRSFTCVVKARHKKMLENLDAYHTSSFYDLKMNFEDFAETLDSQYDFEIDELDAEQEEEGVIDQWVLLDKNDTHAAGFKVIGFVVLESVDSIKLIASSRKNSEILKARINKLFGKKIKFKHELTENVARQYMDKMDLSYEEDLVPERLLENISTFELSMSRMPQNTADVPQSELIENVSQSYMEDYCDLSIPALDGKTPRQAAGDPELRPKLLILMKELVHQTDEENLAKGTNVDINWLLYELGLDEINFPPPPPRTPTDIYDDELDEKIPEDTEGVLIDRDLIKSRTEMINQILDTSERIELFEREFPEMHALIVEDYVPDNPDVQRELLELISLVAFLYVPPHEGIGALFGFEYFEDRVDILFEIADNKGPKHLLESLAQPFVALMIAHDLEEIETNCDLDTSIFPELLIIYTAFSEELNSTLEQFKAADD